MTNLEPQISAKIYIKKSTIFLSIQKLINVQRPLSTLSFPSLFFLPTLYNVKL